MLSLIVLFSIHGVCWTYAISPLSWITGSLLSLTSCKSFLYRFLASSFFNYWVSASLSWSRNSLTWEYLNGIRSPMIDDKRLLFPAPTSPMIQTNSPFFTFRSMSLRTRKESRETVDLSSSSTFFLLLENHLDFFFWSELVSLSFFVEYSSLFGDLLEDFSSSSFFSSSFFSSSSFVFNPQVKLDLLI